MYVFRATCISGLKNATFSISKKAVKAFDDKNDWLSITAFNSIQTVISSQPRLVGTAGKVATKLQDGLAGEFSVQQDIRVTVFDETGLFPDEEVTMNKPFGLVLIVHNCKDKLVVGRNRGWYEIPKEEYVLVLKTSPILRVQKKVKLIEKKLKPFYCAEVAIDINSNLSNQNYSKGAKNEIRAKVILSDYLVKKDNAKNATSSVKEYHSLIMKKNLGFFLNMLLQLRSHIFQDLW